MYCKNCGQQMDDNAAFCGKCGQRHDVQEDAPYNQAYSPAYAGPAYEVQPMYQPVVKTKKKRGCLIAFLVVLILLIAAVSAVYFLLPGLLRPYDLNIKPSEGAYKSFLSKLDMTKDKAPSNGNAEDYDIIYGEPKHISTSLSSEEITSFLSFNRPDYYAIKAVQVRINDDDTVEISANLDTRYVFSEILGGKYTREDAKSALPMLGLLPDKLNVYCDISGSIVDNQLQSLDINDVSILGISLPDSLTQSDSVTSFIANTFNDYMDRQYEKNGVRIDILEVNDGELDLAGKFPSSITHVPVR